ncbi:MAG TPA: hypothetical protein VHC49_26010 [Mycobacteriales bacterium]|nr:hypothetical protein [Mycobacteriales bacterium]
MSRMRSERWQSRFDGGVLGAAVGSVLGVALQLASGGWHTAGLVLSWVAWSVFVAEAVVMPVLSPAPARWLRGHWLDLLIMLVACPAWPLLFYDLLVAELAPALTFLDAVKLAKLAKSVRVVRIRLGGPAAVTVMLVVTVAVAVEVVRR